MTTDPIIEKIKKLLRMKRGGTPDEIATALRLAQELAAKHGIDLGSVNPDDEASQAKPIRHEDEILGMRCSWESRYAALVVSNFFHIKAHQDINDQGNKYVMRFVGEPWDIQIAIYVYRFLCGHFRREWNTKRGRCKKRQAFMYGMFLGICSKLSELQKKDETGPGLVKLDRVLAYINEHFPDLKKSTAVPKDDSAIAKYRGYVAGRQTNIRSGVTDAGTAEALSAPSASRLLACS